MKPDPPRKAKEAVAMNPFPVVTRVVPAAQWGLALLAIGSQRSLYTAERFEADSVTPVERVITFALENMPVEVVGSCME